MDEFEMHAQARAETWVDKPEEREAFVDGAKWARAELESGCDDYIAQYTSECSHANHTLYKEIERLTGIINHNLAEARFVDGRHMHLYDECERLKADFLKFLDYAEGAWGRCDTTQFIGAVREARAALDGGRT